MNCEDYLDCEHYNKAYSKAWEETLDVAEQVCGERRRPVAFGVGYECEVCGKSGVTN